MYIIFFSRLMCARISKMNQTRPNMKRRKRKETEERRSGSLTPPPPYSLPPSSPIQISPRLGSPPSPSRSAAMPERAAPNGGHPEAGLQAPGAGRQAAAGECASPPTHTHTHKRSPISSPAAGSHRPHAHEIRSLSPVGIVVGD